MTHKTAFLWGPLSSFSGQLAALLLHKGWQVHVATKSALNLFTLSPLDLQSAAQTWLARALGGHDQLHIFQERLRFIEQFEAAKGTKYDAVLFCGLPPNFDEPRAPRAPRAAGELRDILRCFQDVPTFIVSSLWGGIQSDGVVPEEFEFDRRKPQSHWEGVCQQYENRLLGSINGEGNHWHLIRLPLLTGATSDGSSLNFSGLSALIRALTYEYKLAGGAQHNLQLSYNPDATLWFSPVNAIVSLFWRLLEDESRPRICNLVSTQNILNREWVHYLGQAVGYSEVEPVQHDNLSLPGILRKMLNDSVTVKTRNMFEVAGRYQYTPTLLDRSYFERLITFGQKENWGKIITGCEPGMTFSQALARAYFEQYMPSNMPVEIAREATKHGTTVGFYIECNEPLSFVLKAPNDKLTVEELKPDVDHPRVSFHFSGETMTRLVQKRLSLPKALLTREVKMEGPLLDGLRVSNALGRFLNEHPYADDSNHKIEEKKQSI